MPTRSYGVEQGIDDRTVEARIAGTSDFPAPPEAYGVGIVTEAATAPEVSSPWAICEVVTRNSVFRCDARFRCFEVVDRATGKARPGHKFLGRRLVGGQRQLGGTVWLCHPIPLAGSAAVFESPARRSHYYTTSPVESVVLKVTSMTVSEIDSVTAWDSISATDPDGSGR